MKRILLVLGMFLLFSCAWAGVERAILVDGSETAFGTSTNPIRANISGGNITMGDDKWIGLGAAKGLIEFDDTTTDEVNIINSNVGIGTSSPAVNLHLYSSTTSRPIMYLENENNDAITSSIMFIKNSTSPADDDLLGRIIGNGRDDTAVASNFAIIDLIAADITNNTEDGRMRVYLLRNGSTTNMFDINSNSAITTFNDDGINQDFCIKGDNGVNTFFLDAGNNVVGIGTTSPSSTYGGLDIASGGLSLVLGADSTAITRTNSIAKRATLASYHYTNAQLPVIMMYATNSESANSLYIGGGVGTGNSATNIFFYTNPSTTQTTGTERMRITSSGVVNINGTAGTAPSLIVAMPDTQTLINETIITADACGTLKRLTSATVVITNTTNTFTAPAAGNAGCCMDVANVGASDITLDFNANFVSKGGTDVVLTAGDTVRVASDGVDWYMVGDLGVN